MKECLEKEELPLNVPFPLLVLSWQLFHEAPETPELDNAVLQATTPAGGALPTIAEETLARPLSWAEEAEILNPAPGPMWAQLTPPRPTLADFVPPPNGGEEQGWKHGKGFRK